jgi:hypothetical protein
MKGTGFPFYIPATKRTVIDNDLRRAAYSLELGGFPFLVHYPQARLPFSKELLPNSIAIDLDAVRFKCDISRLKPSNEFPPIQQVCRHHRSLIHSFIYIYSIE